MTKTIPWESWWPVAPYFQTLDDAISEILGSSRVPLPFLPAGPQLDQVGTNIWGETGCVKWVVARYVSEELLWES